MEGEKHSSVNAPVFFFFFLMNDKTERRKERT